MADLAFWIDRLLEFLRLRGPSQGAPPPEPAQRHLRTHGLRTKPKKETAR